MAGHSAAAARNRWPQGGAQVRPLLLHGLKILLSKKHSLGRHGTCSARYGSAVHQKICALMWLYKEGAPPRAIGQAAIEQSSINSHLKSLDEESVLQLVLMLKGNTLCWSRGHFINEQNLLSAFPSASSMLQWQFCCEFACGGNYTNT